eukprot:COSAG03_NODE_22429_length_291_cov_0.802083_1_plen_61_part_10
MTETVKASDGTIQNGRKRRIYLGCESLATSLPTATLLAPPMQPATKSRRAAGVAIALLKTA